MIFNTSTLEIIKHLKADMKASLTAPMDDMWENGIIPKGLCYSIQDDARIIGYFVILNGDNLVQFYLSPCFQSLRTGLFKQVINEYAIRKITVGTYDPQFLALTLDLNKPYGINSIIYINQVELPNKESHEHATWSKALPQDQEAVLAYYQLSDLAFPGIDQYNYDLIKNDGLYLFYAEDQLIGTGEIRFNKAKEDHCHIGMTVATHYRNRGYGYYILKTMKILGEDMNLIVLCGTSMDNLASQKTIAKCGFHAYHKILDFSI